MERFKRILGFKTKAEKLREKSARVIRDDQKVVKEKEGEITRIITRRFGRALERLADR